jgi:hypothetical protein
MEWPAQLQTALGFQAKPASMADLNALVRLTASFQ